ncbi:hypothetical protein E5676_scaffold598G00440 [Cucumis melo var. makuwa]|uniref:Uncharacterized protein n=1 Tax=Cucumis melo var. makuwa TaxID=1194695 RepID=A0A5D3BDU9_CUCMM|nr:hypothetical protein E5676_scaffold598G00440 [Cucumis melo var. makuwa]
MSKINWFRPVASTVSNYKSSDILLLLKSPQLSAFPLECTRSSFPSDFEKKNALFLKFDDHFNNTGR